MVTIMVSNSLPGCLYLFITPTVQQYMDGTLVCRMLRKSLLPIRIRRTIPPVEDKDPRGDQRPVDRVSVSGRG
jgi:hypothetical protein